MKYIIATHGHLADGYASAIKVLSGTQDIYTLNAYVDGQFDVTAALKSLLDAFEAGEKVLIFTDVIGGSVTQVVSRLIGEYNIVCITGINLGLVMECIFAGETLNDQRIDEIVEEARRQILCINHILKD